MISILEIIRQVQAEASVAKNLNMEHVKFQVSDYSRHGHGLVTRHGQV